MVMFNKRRYISNYNKYLKKNNNYNFLTEIVYTKLKTTYKKKFEMNNIFQGEYNYYFIFDTNSDTEYILQFDYYRDYIGPFKGEHLYNISFTTYQQYLSSLSAKTDIQQEDIYEKITNNKEEIEIMKRLLYIFNDFHNNINPHIDSMYVIGETDDLRKINVYKDLVKTSISNIKEIKGESSINKGKPVYYFHI